MLQPEEQSEDEVEMRLIRHSQELKRAQVFESFLKTD